MIKKTFAVVLTLLVGMWGVAIGAKEISDIAEPVILVAKPEVRDQLYGSSVLVVVPLGDDQHVGFIVNRPTGVRLGTVFPDHGPSQKVVDPLYLGGPVGTQLIFALVQRPDRPGEHSVALMPGLFAAFDPAELDRIIESDPEHARFLAGLVAWRPGELSAEIDAGAWYVLGADAALVMRKPEGLWEELVRRSQQADNTI